MNRRDGQFDLREVTRGRKAFGFFGRLSAAKGVDILLDVAEELRPRGDICFLFAGTGNLVDRVTEAANRPESNVAYLGILDRRDALSCISQCRSTFAVYDSQQSAFGNPVKIAESIALGAPVIVNDGLGVPDGLRPHCIVVRGRSSSEIADVVARVADSGDRMQVPAGIEDFSIEAIVEKIVLPAYMRLLRL
jgi:glycosyltransferase involved in cell wall biosynthesis